MTGFKRIEDLGDLADKRVLVRADLNVPMRDGVVTDDTRIQAAVPTVRDLLALGANVILMSHFGRPKGERVPEMSLAPLIAPLSAALGVEVSFADDCVGAAAVQAVASMDRVLLLENLRYHAAEPANDAGFAAQLASLGDAYVNDAFPALIGRMPQPKPSRSCCLPPPGDLSLVSYLRLKRRLATLNARLPQLLAGQRSQPKSRC